MSILADMTAINDSFYGEVADDHTAELNRFICCGIFVESSQDVSLIFFATEIILEL